MIREERGSRTPPFERVPAAMSNHAIHRRSARIVLLVAVAWLAPLGLTACGPAETGAPPAPEPALQVL